MLVATCTRRAACWTKCPVSHAGVLTDIAFEVFAEGQYLQVSSQR